MKGTIKGNVITLEAALQEPRLTKTGKSVVVYSTGWSQPVDGLTIKGKPVYATLTLTVRKSHETPTKETVTATEMDSKLSSLLG